jgi:hypothetical protein
MLMHGAGHVGRVVDGEAEHRAPAGQSTPVGGIGIVLVDHGDAVRRQATVDGALLAGHLVEAAHTLEVSALGVGHQGHGRGADLRQVGDLAGAVHAHLDHRRAMPGSEAEQGQRQADVIVQVAARRQHGGAERRLEDGGDHFLGRRLAVRAGHRDHRQVEAGAPGGGEAAEGEARIVDDDRRYAIRQARGLMQEQRHGPGRHRLCQEIVGVEAFAAERDEQLAGIDVAGVRRYAAHDEVVADQAPAAGAGDIGKPPFHHATSRCEAPRAARARRACSISENGVRTPATSW